MNDKSFFNMVCHDCGAKEGELHELGCDMERCPVCNIQAISCYKHCVNGEDGSLKPEFENAKRIPYIILPNYCRRCLEPYPDMFKVSDEEWKKLPKSLHGELLCRNCYDKIKSWLR
jgi:hypothetical protein